MKQGFRWALALGAILLVGCQSAAASPTPTPTSPPRGAISREGIPVGEETANATLFAGLPTPQPPPTLTPTAETVMPLPLPASGAPAPEGAVSRLGIGVIMQAAFSSDSQYLAVGTSVGVYLYEARTLKLLWSHISAGPVQRLAWMPYGDVIAAWNGTLNTVIGYEAGSGRTVFEFEQSGPIGGVAWSPDGTRLAVAWGGRTFYQIPQPEELAKRVTVWDVKSFNKLFTSVVPFDTRYAELVYINLLSSLVWSPDGRWIAAVTNVTLDTPFTGDFPRMVFIWNASTGEVVHSLQQAEVESASFSPDSQSIVAWTYLYAHSVSDDTDVIRLWNPASGEIRSNFEDPKYPDEEGAWDIAWNPDGTQLIIAEQDRKVIRWDVVANQALQRMDYGMFIRDLDWSRSGQLFGAVGWTEGSESRHQAVVWHVGEDKPLYVIDKGYDFNSSAGLAFSPDSQLLVIYGDGRLSIHDASSGVEITPPLLPTYRARIDWSPDGQSIATVSNDGYDELGCGLRTINWNIQSGLPTDAQFTKRCQDVPDAEYDHASVSPDGQWTATVSISQTGEATSAAFATTIVVTRTSDGQEVLVAVGPPAPALLIAWSPDSSTLAVGGGLFGDQGVPDIRGWIENEIMMWNTDKWTKTTFQGHTGQIRDLKFSPDGSRLASASADGTVIIWRVK